MKRAVIYARYSTEMQRDITLEEQVLACTEYANKKGYEIIEVYKDPAKSGRSDKRPDFQRMIQDSALGIFEAVFVHKTDRLHRNVANFYKYEEILNNNNVQLFCMKTPFENDPTGVSKAVAVSLDAYYSKNLGEEVKKGQTANARRAKSTGGKPPLGYDLDEEKHYIINEKEAEIVKEIFTLKANGLGYGKIIEICNQKGYKTKTGATFGKNSLHDLLCNKKYIGTYIYGKVTRLKNGKRNSHQNDSKNVIELPNVIPPIVEMAIWEKVAQFMSETKRTPGTFSGKVDYLLSGKIFCHCGARMTGRRRSIHRKNGNIDYYPYYECNEKHRKNNCKSVNLPKDKIENAVADYLFSMFLSAKGAEELKLKLNTSIQEQMDKNSADRQLYETELAEAKQAMENLFKLIEKGLSDELILDRYQQQKQRYDIAQINIAKCATPPLFTDKEINNIISAVNQKEKSPELIKALFLQFVSRVDVLQDGTINVTSRYRLLNAAACCPLDGAEGPNIFKGTTVFLKEKIAC